MVVPLLSGRNKALTWNVGVSVRGMPRLAVAEGGGVALFLLINPPAEGQ